MATLESVIRPFANPETDPQPYHVPGTVGVPDVRVVIGIKGGTKTFSFSQSVSVSSKMGAAHKEKAPQSPALQQKLSKASS